MLKGEKIFMQAWLDAHGRAKVEDTDQWYLDLANELLPLLEESYTYRETYQEHRHRVALNLAMYLEDCVADGGNWNEFISWHYKSYGRYLPFHQLTSEYVPDEINWEDIAVIFWSMSSQVMEPYLWVEKPFEQHAMQLAKKVYKRMDELFESAPVSESLAEEWFIERQTMERERKPVRVPVPGEKLPVDVERFLEASEGEPLMFFESYDALKTFLVESLWWENKEEVLLPDLKEYRNFVLYANPRGLLIAPDVAACFEDKRNPMYSPDWAEENAYKLFCEQGKCPFDLLKYGMENGLLSEARFPFENGKELLHENWDFVARWFLEDYYEGV